MIDLIALWQRGDAIVPFTQLKPLNEPPPGAKFVWSMRATGAPPGARVLGLIPARNIFVAISGGPRDRLGERGSPPWLAALNACVEKHDAWHPDEDAIYWYEPRRFGSRPEDIRTVCDDF